MHPPSGDSPDTIAVRGVPLGLVAEAAFLIPLTDIRNGSAVYGNRQNPDIRECFERAYGKPPDQYISKPRFSRHRFSDCNR